MRPKTWARSGPFSATRMIAVPTAYSRPPRVKPRPAARTWMPSQEPRLPPRRPQCPKASGSLPTLREAPHWLRSDPKTAALPQPPSRHQRGAPRRPRVTTDSRGQVINLIGLSARPPLDLRSNEVFVHGHMVVEQTVDETVLGLGHRYDVGTRGGKLTATDGNGPEAS